jgi:hypothetical protein
MRRILSVLALATLILGCSSVSSSGPLLPFPHPYRSADGELTPIWKMDFEGTGCEDSSGVGFYSCAVANGADPDCSTGQCPLEGTLSGYLQGLDTMYMAEGYPDDTGELTLDFLLKIDNDSGQNTSAIGVSHIRLAGMYDGNNSRCTLAYNPSTNYMYVNGSETLTNSVGLSLDTTYRVRMLYIAGYKLCAIKISTVGAANGWASGDVFNKNAFGGAAGPQHKTNIVKFHQVGGTVSDLNRFVIDDVALCRGNPGLSTLQCDE